MPPRVGPRRALLGLKAAAAAVQSREQQLHEQSFRSAPASQLERAKPATFNGSVEQACCNRIGSSLSSRCLLSAACALLAPLSNHLSTLCQAVGNRQATEHWEHSLESTLIRRDWPRPSTVKRAGSR